MIVAAGKPDKRFFLSHIPPRKGIIAEQGTLGNAGPPYKDFLFWAHPAHAPDRAVERLRVPVLQFLSPPAADLRYFRFYPLRCLETASMRFQGFEFCFAKLKKLSQPASMPARQPQVVY
jgi:hypothetical protein